MADTLNQTAKALNVIGLMSGTSVDSIDAACVRIAIQPDPMRLIELEVLDTLTLDYEASLRHELLDLMAQPQVSLEAVCRLNVEVGESFAHATLALMDKLKSRGLLVDLVASHGQTIYHIPPAGEHLGSTLQIGEPAVIAHHVGLEVAADFRPADMAAGGHGAPLVSFADKLLFQDDETPRAVQNIGGIANLTALPARNSKGQTIMAFDTGPGNMVLDSLVQELFAIPFDCGGEIAATGKIHPEMLRQLREHPYFKQPPPKSTGRELFGKTFTDGILQQWRDQIPPEDIIATATQFTADTIADAYRYFVLPNVPVREIVAGGGGVMNPVLMHKLAECLEPLGIALKTHEDFGINSKYKEAVAFAMLGYARKMHIPANLPECTGASRPVVMGAMWIPPA
jgi:anhydro-N-acetylmuramic acid kinase